MLRFATGAAMVALTLAWKWSVQQFGSGSRLFSQVPAPAIILDLVLFGAWLVGCVLSVQGVLHPRLRSLRGVWLGGIIVLFAATLMLTQALLPGVKAAAEVRHREDVRKQLSPENLSKRMIAGIKKRGQHEPQSIRLSATFGGLQFSVPAGLPLVTKKPLTAEDLDEGFEAGALCTGQEQLLVAKVECYRISPGYQVDIYEASNLVNGAMLAEWTKGFAATDVDALQSESFSFYLLDEVEREAVLEKLRQTKVEQLPVKIASLAGARSARTLFVSHSGFPFAARSEVLVKEGVLVNVVATSVTLEGLTSGPVDELFRSVTFPTDD